MGEFANEAAHFLHLPQPLPWRRWTPDNFANGLLHGFSLVSHGAN